VGGKLGQTKRAEIIFFLYSSDPDFQKTAEFQAVIVFHPLQKVVPHRRQNFLFIAPKMGYTSGHPKDRYIE
jgi:hypothetical protein